MPEHELENLLEAMPRIAEVVNKFKSEEVQKLAFQHFMESLGIEEHPSHGQKAPTRIKRTASDRKRRTPKEPNPDDGETGQAKKGRKKGVVSPSFVKDLNLRPPKKPSLTDFVAQKSPNSNQQLHIVIVYYLQKTLAIEGISPNHIYTCLKDLKKRVPNDLWATLRVTANKTNGLDTGNREDIKVTVKGENVVDHDLPLNKKTGE